MTNPAQATNKCSSSSQGNKLPNAPTLEDYLERLTLMTQSPYQEFCGAFMHTLCQDKAVATQVMAGKLQLKDNKRQKAVKYVTNLLSDIGGKFIPLGTAKEAVDDLVGDAIEKSRQSGYEILENVTQNPSHFVLLAQALTDALLFFYEPTWCEGPKNGRNTGTSMAKALTKHLKQKNDKKRLTFDKDATLAERLEACFKDLIAKNEEKKWITDSQKNPQWVADKFETFLMFASAQVLGHPADYFVNLNQLDERLEALEKTIEQARSQTTTQTTTEKTSSAEAAPRTEQIVEAIAANAKLVNVKAEHIKAKARTITLPYDTSPDQLTAIKNFIKDLTPDSCQIYGIAPGAIIQGSELGKVEAQGDEFNFVKQPTASLPEKQVIQQREKSSITPQEDTLTLKK